MDKSYSFLSDTEPTDEQLHDLMLAALEDVKINAAIVENKYKTLMLQQLASSQQMWRKMQEKRNNGK
jgi:MinD superfamily P-loop ATPase